MRIPYVYTHTHTRARSLYLQGYLNKLDAEIKNLDVLDDFSSELKEVQRRHGNANVPYTLGDHVARYMLGSVFDAYDKLDGF